MNINEKAKALYIKTQTAMGAEEALTAADIVRTTNLDADIYTGETSTVDYDGGTGRSAVDRHKSSYNTFSFEMDLIGGGDDGGTDIFAPPSAAMLRACGWDMDATTPNQRTFSLSSRDDIDVVTLGMTRLIRKNGATDFDVIRYDTYDARGAVGLSFSDDRPKWMFSDVTGYHKRPYKALASPIGTEQPANFVSPKPFRKDSFASMTLGGVDLCVHTLSIPNLGWTVAPIDVVNCRETSLQEAKILIDVIFKQLDFDTELNVFELAEDHSVMTYSPFALQYDHRVGHIFKANSSVRVMNPKEVALSDGNLGVQAQLEVDDGSFTFGWHAA